MCRCLYVTITFISAQYTLHGTYLLLIYIAILSWTDTRESPKLEAARVFIYIFLCPCRYVYEWLCKYTTRSVVIGNYRYLLAATNHKICVVLAYRYMLHVHIIILHFYSEFTAMHILTHKVRLFFIKMILNCRTITSPYLFINLHILYGLLCAVSESKENAWVSADDYNLKVYYI